jgi:hypothetical protein
MVRKSRRFRAKKQLIYGSYYAFRSVDNVKGKTAASFLAFVDFGKWNVANFAGGRS